MIRPYGEAALLVEVGETARVHALAAALRSAPFPGVVECVPGIDTLLVEIDPLVLEPSGAEVAIAERLAGLGSHAALEGRHRSIPVVYGGEFGPDLDEVGRLTGLSPDEVAQRHAASELTVEILGFAPGFAYLAGLPAVLEVARLATPRTRTAAGSVAIAGRRSGIYPADLPGGWRVIGRSPVVLFDPRHDPPAYLAPGDKVRFVAIGIGEWDAHAGPPSDW